MRFRKNCKGQIRTIEAFFATLLIFATLALIPSQLGAEKTHYNTLHSTGTQAIVTVDSNAKLSQLIEDGNWTALTNCFQSVLPVSLWFNVTVFDEDMNILNNDFVSNGGAANAEIVAVNYVCASSSKNYAVYVVQLQLAEAK